MSGDEDVWGDETERLLESRPKMYLVPKVGRARTQWSRRHTPNDLIRSHVLRDNGAGRNDRALTDLHAGEHHCPAPEPGVVADLDRSKPFRKEWIVHVVLVGEEPDPGRDADVVADPQTAASVEPTLAVDDRVLTDRDARLSPPTADPDVQVRTQHDEGACSDLHPVYVPVPLMPRARRRDMGDHVVRQVTDKLNEEGLYCFVPAGSRPADLE